MIMKFTTITMLFVDDLVWDAKWHQMQRAYEWEGRSGGNELNGDAKTCRLEWDR